MYALLLKYFSYGQIRASARHGRAWDCRCCRWVQHHAAEGGPDLLRRLELIHARTRYFLRQTEAHRLLLGSANTRLISGSTSVYFLPSVKE